MAIQHRRGNFADFDPFKMRPGEWSFPLDRGEGYYCISPGDVRRVATKEEVIEILETSQEAYDGLQQLLTELEDETVLTGMLADISDLVIKSNKNESELNSLDTKVNTHLAEKATQAELGHVRLPENEIIGIPQNGWINGSFPIKYYKDDFNRVHVQGVIAGGTTSANTVVFTLPVGYRPPSPVRMETITYTTASEHVALMLQVDGGGLVTINGTARNAVILDFSFRI